MKKTNLKAKEKYSKGITLVALIVTIIIVNTDLAVTPTGLLHKVDGIVLDVFIFLIIVQE